jgi:hypothetical protein
MRISVELILSLLAQGETPRGLVDDYTGLELDDIRACIAYAHAVIANDSSMRCSSQAGEVLGRPLRWSSARRAASGARHDVREASLLGPDPGDRALLQLAAQEQRVLVTIDTDFGALVFGVFGTLPKTFPLARSTLPPPLPPRASRPERSGNASSRGLVDISGSGNCKRRGETPLLSLDTVGVVGSKPIAPTREAADNKHRR